MGIRELGSSRLRLTLQDTTPDELLSAVMTAVLQDVKLKPEQLGDISVGKLPCGSCPGPSPPSFPRSVSHLTDVSY